MLVSPHQGDYRKRSKDKYDACYSKLTNVLAVSPNLAQAFDRKREKEKRTSGHSI